MLIGSTKCTASNEDDGRFTETRNRYADYNLWQLVEGC
jgi:hypothetical protein